MNLSKLTKAIKNKKTRRVGRGPGSGCGSTSGRGNKGRGQHAVNKVPYVGFEGGNTPYFRTIPKRGFTQPRKKEYQIINLKDIQVHAETISVFDPHVLKELKLIKDERKPIKILAKTAGDFTPKALFKAAKFSHKAKELIEAAGGKTERIKMNPAPRNAKKDSENKK